MAHGHQHHGHHQPSSPGVTRKLAIAAAATVLFVGCEVVVGFRANSLALLGDAVHNFTDALALVLALVAVRIEQRPPTSAKSYGYHRAGVLAAFVNASSLAALTIFLFIEAGHRWRHPQPVDSGLMLATAAAALVLNGAITLWLREEGQSDLNVRAAVIHMFGDAVSSVGIIGAALLIRTTGQATWDPAISVLIGLLILWSSWGVLRESINLLLEGTPRGIDPEAVGLALASLDGVYGVHHLHIWAIAQARPALSCHLMLGDVALSSTGDLLRRVNSMLEHDFGIVHTTIQLEHASCSEDDPSCIPFTSTADVVRPRG